MCVCAHVFTDTSFKRELEGRFSVNSDPVVSFVLTVWQVGCYFLLCSRHPQPREPLHGFSIPCIGLHCGGFCFSKNLAFQIEPLLSTPPPPGCFPTPRVWSSAGPPGRRVLNQRKGLRKMYEQQLNDNNCWLEKAPSLRADGWWAGQRVPWPQRNIFCQINGQTLTLRAPGRHPSPTLNEVRRLQSRKLQHL